jgi:hypothetical protein
MDLKKGIIKNIVKRDKKDNSGSYYSVKVELSDGTKTDYLCFDSKMSGMKEGDSVEFTSIQKGDVWYLNFPKDRGGYGGKAPWTPGVKKDDNYAKINGLLQTHTMPMSYAKDVTVALINIGSESVNSVDKIEEVLFRLYRKGRDAISQDRALMALLLASGSAEAATGSVKEEIKMSKVHLDFNKALIDFMGQLDDIPKNFENKVCRRLSMIKTPEGLVGGQERIKDMTDVEAKTAFDRFQMFNSRECKKKPVECDYIRDGGACTWISVCPYWEKED